MMTDGGKPGKKTRTEDDDLSLQVLRNGKKRGDEASVKMPCRQGV